MRKIYLFLLFVMALCCMSGCVKDIQRSWQEIVGGNKPAERVDIYASIRDESWKRLWKAMRALSPARELMSRDTFRLKFLVDGEPSWVPIGQYEMMSAHDKEKAYAFIDFIMADPAFFTKDSEKARHKKMNMWIDNNWPGGQTAFMRIVNTEGLQSGVRMKGYLQEFKELHLTVSPTTVVNGKEDKNYMSRLLAN